MGPTTGVFLRNPLSHDQIADLGNWLAGVSTKIQGKPGDWALWMDGGPVGCPSGQDQCTILVFLRGPGVDDMGLTLLWEWEPAEIDQLNTILGQAPEQEIGIAAMCNGRINHCLIGHLALHFAQTFDGVIDFNGFIDAPRHLWDHAELSTNQRLSDARAYVSQFPGTVWEIGGEEDGRPRHIFDASFMEAWLTRPDFRMVK